MKIKSIDEQFFLINEERLSAIFQKYNISKSAVYFDRANVFLYAQFPDSKYQGNAVENEIKALCREQKYLTDIKVVSLRIAGQDITPAIEKENFDQLFDQLMADDQNSINIIKAGNIDEKSPEYDQYGRENLRKGATYLMSSVLSGNPKNVEQVIKIFLRQTLNKEGVVGINEKFSKYINSKEEMWEQTALIFAVKRLANVISDTEKAIKAQESIDVLLKYNACVSTPNNAKVINELISGLPILSGKIVLDKIVEEKISEIIQKLYKKGAIITTLTLNELANKGYKDIADEIRSKATISSEYTTSEVTEEALFTLLHPTSSVINIKETPSSFRSKILQPRISEEKLVQFTNTTANIFGIDPNDSSSMITTLNAVISQLSMGPKR